MSFTAGQLERTAREWSAVAGEPVRVEEIAAALYGFCSELGALRLMRCYRWTLINRGDVARVSWSENLKTWAFSLDVATHEVPDANAHRSAPQASTLCVCHGAAHDATCPERTW